MVNFSLQFSSFLERDDEYPDLKCGKPAIKRYIRLIGSTNYYSKVVVVEPDMDPSLDIRRELPPNLLTEGRKVTPSLKIKILGALARCSLSPDSEIRIYQLFHLVKFFGWRYDYKSRRWIRDWNRL